MAAVLFEIPTRRAEALAMIDRARALDPLEPRYDLSKAIFLFYGRGQPQAAQQLVVEVLKRDPLYGPALMRLAELGWMRGDLAEAAKAGEQALTLDPLSELTRHVVVASYLDVGDPVAARAVVDDAPHPLATREIQIHAYERDWRRAADAAYDAIANETLAPVGEFVAVAAIRMHARATGDYARARRVLENFSGITWDEAGNPTLTGPINNKDDVVGLADILLASGDDTRARNLLKACLESMDYEARRLERGDFWYGHMRAVAQALLGNKDEAIAELQRLVENGSGAHRAWYFFEVEPAFAELRSDERFMALRATLQQRATRQRQRLVELRADGSIPARPSG